jgi:hypothetical protein
MFIEEISGEDCNPEITSEDGYKLLKWTSQQGYGEEVPADSIICIEFSAKVVSCGEFVNTANVTGYYDCCSTVSADDTAEVMVICESPEVFDFGDAPYNGDNYLYPTLLANNGARHGGELVSAPYMGVGIDNDADGQPTGMADGDDNDGNDDEEGVFFSYPIYAIPGTNQGQVDINMTWSPWDGYLNAWIDFDMDGTWDDQGEQIFTDHSLTHGMMHYELTFTIPESVIAGDTYARFRISSVTGLSYDGAAPNGEVEDYRITILSTLG